MSPPPSQPRQVDVAVVGGGLAGLVAAAMLANTGRSVTLFAPPRPSDRRTTALLGESVAMLRRAGIWNDVADGAEPLRAIRIVDATRRLIRAPEVRFDAAELGLDAFGYNVPNEPMLAALEAAVDRQDVLRIAAPADEIHPETGSVGVTTARGDAVQARLVVGADGRNSAARAAARIAVTGGEPSGQAALVCDLRHERPHDGVSTEFHSDQGPFTLVPLKGLSSALVWVMKTANAARMKSEPADRLAAAIERQSQYILGPMTVASPAQTFPLSTSAASRAAANRIALVGESAHVLPPIAAQGFNLTLRDIEALVELVSEAGSDCGATEVIAEYDRRRRADTTVRALAVGLLNWSLLTGFLPAQAARGLGLHALDRIPPLRRALMRRGLGVG